MEILATRMRELRKEAGLSQSDAAKALGIAMPTYVRYEYNQREPMAPTILALAELYHVSIDYLFGLKDER